MKKYRVYLTHSLPGQKFCIEVEGDYHHASDSLTIGRNGLDIIGTTVAKFASGEWQHFTVAEQPEKSPAPGGEIGTFDPRVMDSRNPNSANFCHE